MELAKWEQSAPIMPAYQQSYFHLFEKLKVQIASELWIEIYLRFISEGVLISISEFVVWPFKSLFLKIKVLLNMSESKDLQQPLIESKPEKPTVKPVAFSALFKYADSLDRIYMLVGSLAAMGAGCATPLFVIFFGQISEIFIPGNESKAREQAFHIMVKFFLLGGGTWLLNFVGLYCWNMTGSRQALRFKKLYYSTLLQQEVAWYDSNDVNKLATEISSNMVAVQTAIGEKISILLTTIVTSVFGFFYAYFKCWQLSIVLTAMLPLVALAGILLMKAMTFKASISKVSYEDASGIAEQAFGGIRTIKSMVAESFENNKFVAALSASQKKVTKFVLLSSICFGVMNLLFLGLYSFGFFYGKHMIITHPSHYTAPLVIATFFCFLVGGASVGQISPIMKNIAEGRVAAGQLYSMMDRKKTLIEPENGVKVNQIDIISIKDVTFKYEKVDQPEEPQSDLTKRNQITEDSLEETIGNRPEQIVLSNINLSFPKGKVTALVGESGCGKSTIIQLLMRFYDPTAGSVSINGYDLKELDLQNYRQKIGFVGQEPVLFSMTIAENLKLSNPDLTTDQMMEVLHKANAWDFVNKNTASGLDTYVGANGTQLSGGQKQRIAIARAIAHNPSILILDEATSALDRKNEKEIQKTLSSLSAGNITTIVIAHRLSTIRNADNIVVLNKGQILEQGTHEDLYNNQGPYFDLVKSQMAAESHNHIEEESKQEISEATEVPLEAAKEKKDEVVETHPKEKLDAVFGKLFKEFKGSYAYLFVGSLAAFSNGLVWPFFNIAFSNIMALMAHAKQNSAEINKYCLIFLAVAVGGGILTFLYMHCFGIAGERLVLSMRKKLFSKLLRLDVSYYDRPDNTPGGLSTKLSQDTYQIHNMITGVMSVVCLNVSTIASSLALAFYYSWQLTLIVLALAPLMAITGSINMSVLKGMSQKSESSEKAAGSLISDTVCNIRTVKSFGKQDVFQETFDSKLTEISNLNSEKAFKTSFLQGLSRGSVMFVEGLTFWIAAILFSKGVITDPKAIYIAIFSIIFAAMGAGQNSQFLPDMGKAKHSGANIFEILQSKDEVEVAEETEDEELKGKTIEGNFEFRDVVFKYPSRDSMVLNGISFLINKGEKVGFVGPSGSGKSTIVQLLMRFYPIESGQILVDGKDIKSYNLYSYRKQLGLVSQEPTLFLGTVRDNIIYNSEATGGDKELDKIAKTVHAKNFIEEWTEKYEKDVGQKGSQVSGGQKQRIALARCLIRNPAVVLLDESTSALDADTEKIVFENLKKPLKGKTSISIAHRLSTIEDADRVIVMRDGKIIEQGGYKELMSKKENFYRLAQGIN